MTTRILSVLAACVVAAPAFCGPADNVVDLEILEGWRTDRGTHMAGLQFTLADGWKTYWRVPVMAVFRRGSFGTGRRIWKRCPSTGPCRR